MSQHLEPGVLSPNGVEARRIRILADDLTGALDTAAAFAGNAPVFIDHPPADDSPHASVPVSVVATPTRDIAPDALADWLQPTLAWLASGDVAYKKIDSLLRGNSLREVAWIARHGHYELSVFAPAFPTQGRITTANRQWVAWPGSAAQAVAAPLREALGALGFDASNELDTQGRPPTPGGAAGRCWVPEVVNDSDLDTIVAEIEDARDIKPLWCGSAGLAHALARRWKIAATPDRAGPLPRLDGPSVLVSASFQPILREQWSVLCNSRQSGSIARGGKNDEIAAVFGQAKNGAREAWFELSPKEWLAPEEASRRLTQHTAGIVDALPKPGQLIVVGGDTLLGLCRASGATALLTQPAFRAGWGCARLVGGHWDGVPCYSRSGAFGEANDLLQMIRLLDSRQTT